MKKLVTIIFAIYSIIFTNYASVPEELDQTIRGTVTDAVTVYPIPGATVILSGFVPLIGTSTDVNGKFDLRNVPLGRQSVEISLICYETKVIPGLFLTSGKEVSLKLSSKKRLLHSGR